MNDLLQISILSNQITIMSALAGQPDIGPTSARVLLEACDTTRLIIGKSLKQTTKS